MPRNASTTGLSESSNANTLRDCVSAELLRRIADTVTEPKSKTRSKSSASASVSKNGRKRAGGRSPGPVNVDADTESGNGSTADNPTGNDQEDLADFIDYLSTELLDALPPEIQNLSYSAVQRDAVLAERLSPANSHAYVADTLIPLLPPSIAEGITAYALIPAGKGRTGGAENMLSAALEAYIGAVTAGPPVWASTRADVDGACEICERDWLPLTYHHLIPKSVHERVLKRGWHEEWMLGSVAWLCRACHNYVHSVESNEALAREWFTVERLLMRDDVRRWAAWAKTVRWKAR